MLDLTQSGSWVHVLDSDDKEWMMNKPAQRTRQGLQRLLVFSFFAAVLLYGCASRVAHVTNTPAGVTEQQAKDWDAAVADLQKVATVTTGVRQAVIAARNDGAFPDDKAYGLVLQSLAKVDRLQLAASAILKQQPSQFGAGTKVQVGTLIQQILSELQQLNAAGVTGIKNPQSLQAINTLLAEAIAAAKLVLALTS